MRIAQVNMVPNGSTGKIMLQIAKVARDRGYETKTYSTEIYNRFKKPSTFSAPYHRTWGSFRENTVHYILGSLLGRNGCFSRIGTRKLVKELAQWKPDVLHLHNLHCYCIHLSTLFRYIKENDVRVVWTLHDCWAFTGQCPHFEGVGCEKWRTGCHHCPQIGSYPKAYRDNSRQMYRLKKQWFTGVKDMTLVTPSHWLADLVKQSFLKDYPVKVIHNGIDLSVFKPTPSNFRERYGIPVEKKIILGVAFGWGVRKGLDVFVELAKRLDNTYQIVLVGTDEKVDAQLPGNVISIHKTGNQQDLAEIYAAADLFVNPTREDTYPTVNMEALACGTPVLTFRTGGSPEIPDETCGSVVEKDNVDALEKEIVRIFQERTFLPEDCLRRAAQFDMYLKYEEYIGLYTEDEK